MSRKQDFDSGSQDLPDSPGSSRQLWQALQSVLALLGAAIRQGQKPTLRIQLMETKTTTQHSFSRARMELWSSSLAVICELTGDRIELEMPYGVLRDALKEYTLHRLSRSTQEDLISLLTDEFRKRDEADAKAEV